jgi:hypothetical protein
MSAYPQPERPPLDDEWPEEDVAVGEDDPEVDALLEELDLPPEAEPSDEDPGTSGN